MMTELPMKQWGSKMVVNWNMVTGSYVFGEHIVEIITNKMVEKIAKVSGNKRKERRLEVRLSGFEDVYECGTESFKKGSFLKNLIKKSIHKLIEAMVKPTNYLPVVYNPIRKNFLGETDEESMNYMFGSMALSWTVKECRMKYKKFIKNYHPDFLGRELFPHEQIMYDVLKQHEQLVIEKIKWGDEFIEECYPSEIINAMSEEEKKQNMREDEAFADLTEEELEAIYKAFTEH